MPDLILSKEVIFRPKYAMTIDEKEVILLIGSNLGLMALMSNGQLVNAFENKGGVNGKMIEATTPTPTVSTKPMTPKEQLALTRQQMKLYREIRNEELDYVHKLREQLDDLDARREAKILKQQLVVVAGQEILRKMSVSGVDLQTMISGFSELMGVVAEFEQSSKKADTMESEQS